MDLGERLGLLTAYEFRPGRGFDRQSVMQFRSLVFELISELVAAQPAVVLPAVSAPAAPATAVSAPAEHLSSAPRMVPVPAPMSVMDTGSSWVRLAQLSEAVPARRRAARRRAHDRCVQDGM